MPTSPNPETHCTSCGELLSIYGHCWQHDWPPMDPREDAAVSPGEVAEYLHLINNLPAPAAPIK